MKHEFFMGCLSCGEEYLPLDGPESEDCPGVGLPALTAKEATRLAFQSPIVDIHGPTLVPSPGSRTGWLLVVPQREEPQ